MLFFAEVYVHPNFAERLHSLLGLTMYILGPDLVD